MLVTSQQTGGLIEMPFTFSSISTGPSRGNFQLYAICIGDADKAPAVVDSTTATHPSNTLCAFFHMVKNVVDQVSSFSGEAVSLVFKHLYQMHYSNASTEFTVKTAQALAAWTSIPVIRSV
ncbi:hypothetical protein JG687_00013572 [Phytophthora cactorum]|uniref:MULE transposase domain-containing protein n=1 Tax=Phytophthora cactorum TaxID=29920 RepID=A0A8T1U1J4_9STRA|nr:hypothetical protein JG687_00013572 [Phytophthora cactorum]